MYEIGFFTALILSTISATVFIVSNWDQWKKETYTDEHMKVSVILIGIAMITITSWIGVLFIITASLTKYIYNKRKGK